MSQGFLLDSNLVSEQTRPHPEFKVARWFDEQPPGSLFLSAITVGEVRTGIALLPFSKRRSRLEDWLQSNLILAFFGRILPVTQEVANRWGVLTAIRQLAGNPLNLADGLIAATALEHDLVLVTRNTKHFGGIGLSLLNPWDTHPQMIQLT